MKLELGYKDAQLSDSEARVATLAMQFEGMPPEKIKAMQDYAKRLRKSSPKMKAARIQRKVAEKFHVNIV